MTGSLRNKVKIKISGINLLDRLQLIFLIHKCRNQLYEDVEIEFTDTIMRRKHDSLWYGGEVAVIRYMGYRFILSATGDVCASLLDIGDKNRTLFEVKDKANSGYLADELMPYIKTDKVLTAAMNGSHKRYHLALEHNNWWECFLVDPKGTFHDLMLDLNSDDVFEAAAEIVASLDEIITYTKEEAL